MDPVDTITRCHDCKKLVGATYTRGACQANEQAINNMLLAHFGDQPERF